MAKYEIIDKPDNIQWGKWQRLFQNLPFGKAIKMAFPLKEDAQRQAKSIQGTLRQNRKNPMKIHSRVILNGDNYLLYVWKEANNDNKSL